MSRKVASALLGALAFASTPFLAGAAFAEPLQSPAYIQQASELARGLQFSMPSMQEAIGPIASITDGLPALGPAENFGLVTQDGVGHLAALTQTGGRHIALIQQSGSGHVARISQSGSGHRAFAMQSGRNNVAIISQR